MSDRDPLADTLGECGLLSDRNADAIARIVREHIAAEIESAATSGEHPGTAAYGNECRWEAGMERAARIARGRAQ